MFYTVNDLYYVSLVCIITLLIISLWNQILNVLHENVLFSKWYLYRKQNVVDGTCCETSTVNFTII